MYQTFIDLALMERNSKVQCQAPLSQFRAEERGEKIMLLHEEFSVMPLLVLLKWEKLYKNKRETQNHNRTRREEKKLVLLEDAYNLFYTICFIQFVLQLTKFLKRLHVRDNMGKQTLFIVREDKNRLYTPFKRTNHRSLSLFFMDLVYYSYKTLIHTCFFLFQTYSLHFK